MALINCPECSKSVSDRADNCIHCGFPLKQTQRPPVPSASTIANPVSRDAPEKVFLDHGTIKVTNSRVIAGAQTFSVQNITSVASVRDEGKFGWALLWVLFTIAFFAAGSPGGGIFFLLCAIYVFYRQMTRPTYVMLHTSGGEQKAYSSTNESEISTIVNAVNEAIVYRG